jgi:hypothetical protein
MNFKELLDYPVESVDNDAYVLVGFYYNHLQGMDDLYSLDDSFKAQDRISIHYLKDFCFDGRRVWRLYYVKFDGQLVMICKNAGRDGDDHHGNKIFNTEAYSAMIRYIKSFETVDDCDQMAATLEDDASEFVSFYGNSLGSYFERY